jgi:hypothetical protein
MKLCAKVVATMWHWPAIVRASALMAGARFDAVLLKFMMSKDYQVVLRACKGLVGTKLGLDKDLTPAQQARKQELWPLYKEAEVVASARSSA